MSRTRRLVRATKERATSVLNWIGVITDVIRYSQISVIVVAGGALILLANDQGREVTVHMGRSLGPELVYFLSVTFWAAQAWFWARLALTIIYGPGRGANPLERTVVSHFPRILGAAAFLITAAAFYQAGSNGLAAGSLLAGALFYAVVVLRRALTDGSRPEHSIGVTGMNAARQDLGLLLPIMAGLSVVAIIAGTVLALASPVRFGTLLGGGPVAFIALGSIIPAGSALNLYALRKRFPLVTGLLILVALFSLTNDNHLIRHTAEEPLRAEPAPEFRRWAERLPGENGEAGHPFIIVSTAGGGLRAAYWTTTVLGAVQDRAPQFSGHIFAISGVSGGSLGATIFTSLLAGRDLITCNDLRPPASGCLERTAQDVLSRDFLGPTMMSLLYTDFMQRFLPVAFLPDRAQALENSWSVSWNDHTPQALHGRLADGFTAQWREARRRGDWLPALLLNGTLREDGKRVVTSHLQMRGEFLPSTYDFFDLHCGPADNGKRRYRDVPVISAIMNSARFPYITPAGTMRNCHQPGINHILDGGYFENFGAVTALDLLNWAVSEAAQQGIPIRPVVVQIVSDPVSPLSQQVAPFQFPARGNGSGLPLLPPEGNAFLSEVLAPVNGIFSTRSARGILAAAHLKNRVLELSAEPPSPFVREPLYVRLELVDVAGAEPPSLGWVLSETSRTLIRNQIVCIESNRKNLMRLLAVFGIDEDAPEGRFKPVDCLAGTPEEGGG
ncbi:MAG: patatin-like phospholipase family protein [Alphaproteobacteria bacterium]